jgi:hypothetical protein
MNFIMSIWEVATEVEVEVEAEVVAMVTRRMAVALIWSLE